MPDDIDDDVLSKLSNALVAISRGDPLIALRNETNTRFKAVEVRFDAIDKATALQHEDQVRIPTQIDRAILGLREFLEQSMKTVAANLRGDLDRISAETAEKFAGVAAQFSERDTRTDQRAGDTKLAVDAAFAAAKEATAKIEAGFTKQIDSMIEIIDTKTANLSNQISDLKDRMTAAESRSGVSDPNINAAVTLLSSRLEMLTQSGAIAQGQTAGHSDANVRMIAILAVAAAVVMPILEFIMMKAH